MFKHLNVVVVGASHKFDCVKAVDIVTGYYSVNRAVVGAVGGAVFAAAQKFAICPVNVGIDSGSDIVAHRDSRKFRIYDIFAQIYNLLIRLIDFYRHPDMFIIIQ